jgi:hypothetical protein
MNRVSAPNEYWSRPLATLPMVDRITIVAGVTPNSSMIAR